MVHTNVRLHPDSVHALNQLYGTTTRGIQKSINAFVELRKAYLYNLKGKFTREEIISMAASLNGTMMEERFMANPSTAFAGFEDSEKYEGTFTGNNANFKQFREKFSKLTPSESFFLLEEINRFWNEPEAYGSPSPNLDELIKILA